MAFVWSSGSEMFTFLPVKVEGLRSQVLGADLGLNLTKVYVPGSLLDPHHGAGIQGSSANLESEKRVTE